MKKTLWIYVALGVMLLLLSACESGGSFLVRNNTSFPAYVRVEGNDQVTIPAGGEYSFEVETDTQSMFTGEVSKDVQVWIVGETFSLWDSDTLQYTDYTWVNIKAGETLEAYLNPNRASIKLVNNSSQEITQAEIWKHSGGDHVRVGTISNVAPGASSFLRVDFASPNNQFNYTVHVVTPGNDPVVYGDASTILAKDEQFLVTHTDITKK